MGSEEESKAGTAVPQKKKVLGSLATAESVQAIMATQSEVHAEPGERMAVDPVESRVEANMLSEFERRRRARMLSLPTDDVVVKLKLRSLNQPICLFGEDIHDRKERLRALLSTMTDDQVAAILHSEDMHGEDKDEEKITWYYPAKTPGLRLARLHIADYSLRRAKTRLEEARRHQSKPTHEKALVMQETHKWIQQINLHASQVADTRPVAFCEFSSDSEYIVTAGWSGQPAVWRRENCEKVVRYTGHQAQCGVARFHPDAFTVTEKGTLHLASAAHDGTVYLWSMDKDTPLAELERHPARVSKIAFHQTGRYLATACFDSWWRLFDVETAEELLIQEGHSKAVFDIAFQTDGSVALTGGLDCYGRVWDLRTGRCIMFLDGHTKEIHTVEWMPNGYEMVTGGADNTLKVWDLRMRKNIYTMPAHTSVVSRVRADKNGQYLVSAGFDTSLKFWSTQGWQPLRSLQGHDTKIMCVDISPDGNWLISASFDRTFKVWTQSDY